MRTKPIAAFLAVVFFGAYVAVAWGTFRDHPFSMDEYGYLHQAKIFSSGRLGVEAPPWAAPLVENHCVFARGAVFSKYPPFFSALLAPFVPLGITGLLNPLLSVLSLAFLFRILRRVHTTPVAGWTTALVATNLYFVDYACVRPRRRCRRLRRRAAFFLQLHAIRPFHTGCPLGSLG